MPVLALPQAGALLVLLGLLLVLWSLVWRWWAVAGAARQGKLGGGSVLRIMVGVAGGIVLAQVLLFVMVAALAR